MQPLLIDPTKYVSLDDNPAQLMYDQLAESSFSHSTADCEVKCDVPCWAVKVLRGCDSVKFYLSIVDGKFSLVSFEPLFLLSR